jgi:4-methylaminobutanoate oxidase (formaldehyde-forming)
VTAAADIIVIGGGVIGCAVAWRLAAIERLEVLLLERNELGSGASARAAGLVVPLRASAGAMWFVDQTLTAFRELPDAGFRQVGTMHVAVAEPSRSQLVAMIAHAACACGWIDRAEAERRAPWLDAGAAAAIAFVPGGGFVDPYLATTAYARAAREAGATLRPRTAILEIVAGGEGVTGVRTEDGLIRARSVVVAAGAWSAPLVDRLGISLPMSPVRSHYWITAPDPVFAAAQPVIMLPDAHAYTRPEQDRLVLGARESRSPSWDARTLPADIGALAIAGAEEQWDGLVERGPALRRLVPRLDQFGMAHYVAGLSTYTADGRFLLGPVERVPGLIVATGCNGSGIAASAGIARIVADIVAGRSSPIDRNSFKPDRFGSFDAYAPEFRERCAAARASKATATSS